MNFPKIEIFCPEEEVFVQQFPDYANFCQMLLDKGIFKGNKF